MNTHKYFRIPDGNVQTKNRLFVTINIKTHVNRDQSRSDVVVFEIFYFQIYKLVTEWKHGTSTSDIITFNEKLENVSTSLIELINIYAYSYDGALVVLN